MWSEIEREKEALEPNAVEKVTATTPEPPRIDKRLLGPQLFAPVERAYEKLLPISMLPYG